MGILEFVTFQQGLPQVFWNCSVFDPQGAAQQPVSERFLGASVRLTPRRCQQSEFGVPIQSTGAERFALYEGLGSPGS
jgi:hypothetical protein